MLINCVIVGSGERAAILLKIHNVWALAFRFSGIVIGVACLGSCSNYSDRVSASGEKTVRTPGAVNPTASGTNGIANPSSEPTRNLVESKESVYNNIYVYRTGANLSMTFGYNQKIYTESIYNPQDDRDLPSPYNRLMTSSLMYAKNINSILEIGSGGGRIAWYLHRFLPETQITTVELDPAVVELAHKYFGVKEETNFHEVTRDGRIFLAGSKEKYDIILIDAYRGPFVPFHMLTKEFYQIVRDHLSVGGVLVQNVEPTTLLFDSDVNTLHEVFSNIEFYDASGSERAGNVVLIAYNGDALTLPDLNHLAEKLEFRYTLRYDLREMLAHRFLLRPVLMGSKVAFDIVDQTGRSTAGIDENAKILTDDFAPVDALKAIENHNHKWNTATR